MKTLAYVLLGFVLIFCLTGIASSNVEASNYLGDFCWQLTPTYADPGWPTYSVKLGIFDMGGGHYYASGKGHGGAGHGNVEIDGNNIVIALTFSGASEPYEMMAGTWHIILDISTLNGTWHSIGFNHEDEDGISKADLNYGKGIATFIQCP